MRSYLLTNRSAVITAHPTVGFVTVGRYIYHDRRIPPDHSDLRLPPAGCFQADTAMALCYRFVMPAKHCPHIAPTDPLVRFIERQSTEGRFALVSEGVRAGMRLVIVCEDAKTQQMSQDCQTHG